MEEKEMNLISIDEYLEQQKARNINQKKRAIPDSWLCTIAGILLIISGIISFKYCSILLVFSQTDTMQYDFCWTIFQLVVGIPSIIGGLAAITRRKYQYALAGAALSTITTIVLGIVALIFLVIAQDEFEKYEDK